MDTILLQRWFDNASTDVYMHFKSSADPIYISLPLGITRAQINAACQSFNEKFVAVYDARLQVIRVALVGSSVNPNHTLDHNYPADVYPLGSFQPGDICDSVEFSAPAMVKKYKL